MDEILKQHVDYLDSDQITFSDKKIAYQNYAEELAKYPDKMEASKVWSKVTAALTYVTVMNGEEKNIIRNLYHSNLKGSTSGAAIIKRFEVEKRRDTLILQSYLNTESMTDIIKARELALEFITATQGKMLFESIYNIAEATYFEDANKYPRDIALKHAFERFVQLIRNPLFDAEDQEKYIKIAREVYLKNES